MKDIEIEKIFKILQAGDLYGLKQIIINTKEGEHRTLVNSIYRKKSGDSLMHVAARSADFKLSGVILKYLIDEHKGNIELANLDGKTPLHDAAQFSNLDALECLINAGANVNAVKKADWTPLMLACTKENPLIVKTLLDNNADPFFVNKDGWNSFHIATRKGHLKIIKELFKTCDDKPESREKMCHFPSKNGRRPLHTTVMHGHFDVVNLLLQEACIRSNVDVQDQCGTTALMDACRFDQANIVDLLIKFGADLQMKNRAGMNCLHVAAEAGCSKITRHLLTEYHLDVDCCTVPLGMTSLHWAVKEGHIDTISTLLELNANTNLKATNGLTCLELAKKLHKTEFLEFLERYFITNIK